MRRLIVVILFLLPAGCFAQQKLKPGFDVKEYVELLSLAFYSKINLDSMPGYKAAHSYRLVYRSEEMGLANRWTFYLRDDEVGIIDIRGTVNKTASWLANFYAAMVPATGSLQLNDTTVFEYQLATDDRATVHVGWTIAMAYLGPDIIEKINENYSKKNLKEYIVTGHSQGGALAFLIRSYLEYQMKKGSLPPDLVIKTYCSAAPKPGNMFYAYDFDFITRNGWGFNVVNSMDWVPETPISIQRMQDMNQPNPIRNLPDILGKQNFFVRMVGKNIYNKLERKPRKAQRKYERYLGDLIFKHGVKKTLPQLKEPPLIHSANYMRAGVPVVLVPDKAYEEKYTSLHYFRNHGFSAYYHLTAKYYL